MRDPTNFLRESYRILKTGGIIIIMTPDWVSNMKVYYDDYTHRTPFTIISMKNILKVSCFRRAGLLVLYYRLL